MIITGEFINAGSRAIAKAIGTEDVAKIQI
jgi:hypothetical protein